jgi:polyisoprenoid-binding protein YceI
VTRVLAALCAAFCAASAHGAPYAIDPTHTFVTFEIVHLGTSTTRGRFDRKDGTVQFDRAARSGRVEMAIETASVSTGIAAFDSHLRGKDFFRSSEFPTAKFVADAFVFAGDKVAEVGGTLTLLGRTQPLTLKATRFDCYFSPLFRREVCGGDFEAVIRRSAWGLDWGLEYGVPDDVRLIVEIEAIRQ